MGILDKDIVNITNDGINQIESIFNTVVDNIFNDINKRLESRVSDEYSDFATIVEYIITIKSDCYDFERTDYMAFLPNKDDIYKKIKDMWIYTIPKDKLSISQLKNFEIEYLFNTFLCQYRYYRDNMDV